MSARDIIANGLPRCGLDNEERLGQADEIMKALEMQGFRVTQRLDETAAGMAAPGLPGVLYRLLDRCDYRNVDGWLRGEILRNTDGDLILKGIAGMVASCVLQVAGRRSRPMVSATALQIMNMAAGLLKEDVKAVIQAKKDDTVLRNQLHVVPPTR